MMLENMEWISIEELWQYVADDGYYGNLSFDDDIALDNGIKLSLVDYHTYINSKLRQSILWIKGVSNKTKNAKGEVYIDCLQCPNYKSNVAWTWPEKCESVYCKICSQKFNLQKYIYLKDECYTIWDMCEEHEFHLPDSEKELPQIALIHVWCGLYGLPFYKKENVDSAYTKVECTKEDYLKLVKCKDYSKEKYVVNLKELKKFISKKNIPAPLFLYDFGFESLETGKKSVYHNKFVDKGEYFEIIYNEQMVHIKKMKGLKYIHYLISNKYKEISIDDILDYFEPREAITSTSTFDRSSKELDEEGISISTNVTSSKREYNLDSKAKAQYTNRLREIEHELEQAEDNNNIEWKQRLLSEREKLIMELDNNTYIIKDRDQENNRTKVGNGIKEAVKKLETRQDAKELAAHLRRAMPRWHASPLIYSPSSDIEWITEE